MFVIRERLYAHPVFRFHAQSGVYETPADLTDKCRPLEWEEDPDTEKTKTVFSNLIRFFPQKAVFLSLFADPRVTPVTIKGSPDY